MNDAERRDRLRVIDEDLARLRADLTPPPEAPRDFVDGGQDLAAREELAGQIEVLEAERQRLEDELTELG
ncbi:hypothetical protein AGRA3207_005695 [Actinomadura graeca]|uniref:Uncharacterized protein n=1 Tax=Actinomadura graeca TaxID=2750812 RepID=A0ABX8QZV9_9ACTN|nr:hypothetical protein [Actinomadura graeca]QXJ24381.1 hypothetical protein AGRA3207_005695 [Actinomadura graeca]